MRQPTITFVYTLLLSLLHFSLFKAFSTSSRLRIRRNLIEDSSKLFQDNPTIVHQLKQAPLDTPTPPNELHESPNPSELFPVKPIENEIKEGKVGNKALEQNEIEEIETDRMMDQEVPRPQLRAGDIVYLFGSIVARYPTKENAEMKAMWCLMNAAQLDDSEAYKLGGLLANSFVDFTKQYLTKLSESKQKLQSSYPLFKDFFENFYKSQLSTLPKNWDSIINGIIDAIQRNREVRYRKIFVNFPKFDLDIRKAGSDISARARQDLTEAANGGHQEEIELGLSDPMRALKLASAKILGLSDAADSGSTLYEFWKGLQHVSQVFGERGVNHKIVENYEREMIVAGDFKRIKEQFPELLDPTELPSSSSHQLDEIEGNVKDGAMIASNKEFEDASAYLFGSKTEEIKEFKRNDPETVHKESWIFSNAVLNSPKCIETPEICFDYYLNLAKTMKTQKGIDNFGPPLAKAFLNKVIKSTEMKDWPEPASHLLRTTFGSFFDNNLILEEKQISLLESIHKHVQTFNNPEDFNPFLKFDQSPFYRFPYIRDVNYFKEARSRLISGDSATIRFFEYFPIHDYKEDLSEDHLINDLKVYNQAANLEISRSQNFWTQMIKIFESTQDQPGTPRELMTRYPNLLDRLKTLAPEIQIAREKQWKEFDEAAKEKARLEKLARLKELEDASKQKPSLLVCLELVRTATSWVCKRYKNQPSQPELRSVEV